MERLLKHDWMFLDSLSRGEEVDFASATRVVGTFNAAQARVTIPVPASADRVHLPRDMIFLQIWTRLQGVHRKLAHDFPASLYHYLYAAYPSIFPFLSRHYSQRVPTAFYADPEHGNDHERCLGKNDDEATEPTRSEHRRSNELSNRSDVHAGDQRDERSKEPRARESAEVDGPRARSFGAVVLRLFEAYEACVRPSLPVEFLTEFRNAVQRMNPAQRIVEPQDALELVLYSMLAQSPAFARLTELTMSFNEKTKEQTISARDSQFAILAARATLQETFDAYQSHEDIPGFKRDIRFAHTSDVLFAVINQPYGQSPVRLNLLPNSVLVAGRNFSLAGVVFLHSGHFCVAVETLPAQWVFFNDLQPAPQHIPDFTEFCAHLPEGTERVLMLVATSGTTMCGTPICVNLPNVSNSCYMSAILQLLFHCAPYLDSLRRELQLTDEELAARNLPPFQVERILPKF